MRKPDYERDGVQLYLGDCLEILPELGKVDACITSPPYCVGNNNMSQRHKEKYKSSAFGVDASSIALERLITGVIEQLVAKAEITFFNIQSCSSNKQIIARMLGKYADYLKERMVWIKDNPPPAMEPGVLDNAFEDIFVFSGSTSNRRKFYGSGFRGMKRNVLRTPVNSSNEYTEHHRALFPLEVPLYCLSIVESAETVLDPFAGLCTTGVACIRTGRKFIGIELEPKYFEIAVKRIEAEFDRMPLFAEEQTVVTQSQLFE